MDIQIILIRLANTPESVKVYRDLQAYYEQSQKIQEAEAIACLIEIKFGKKDDAIDGTNVGEEQLDANSRLS